MFAYVMRSPCTVHPVHYSETSFVRCHSEALMLIMMICVKVGRLCRKRRVLPIADWLQIIWVKELQLAVVLAIYIRLVLTE